MALWYNGIEKIFRRKIMQCPNCGRKVRSKTRCAFCGHEFDGSEVKINETPAGFTDEEPKVVSQYDVEEYEEDYEDYDDYDEVVPKTKRRGGFLRIIWGIIKLALAIFIIFLLIAFGPKYAGKLWDQFGFGGGNSTPSETVTVVEETTVAEESTSSDETTVKETTLAPETASNVTVNTDDYPLTVLSFELADASASISREDIEVGVVSNGIETLVENYSLLKEGNKLTVSFNNPAVQVVAADQPEQEAFVRSQSAGIDVISKVDIPTLSVNTEQYEQINSFVTDNLSSVGDATFAVQAVGEDAPIVYANQTVDASQLFAWFVLARTFDAIESDDLTFETLIQVMDALKAEGDEGTLAYEEEGIEYTVEELVNLVVAQDVTAMNHLIQATGGPNAFNLWLTEQTYFDTKVNELLGTDAEGHLSGTTTSVQDVMNLLAAITSNELFSEELTDQLKTALLQTPITEKYPTTLEVVKRRFEIASDDADSTSQAYAAILEAEDKDYVVVINVANPSDAVSAVNAIRATLTQVINYLATGDVVDPDEVEETTEEITEEVTEEVTSVYEEVTQAYQPAVTTVQGGFESPGGYIYGADTNGDGYPNTVYDNATGTYRNITWSQGQDGLYYFNYAE